MPAMVRCHADCRHLRPSWRVTSPSKEVGARSTPNKLDASGPRSYRFVASGFERNRLLRRVSDTRVDRGEEVDASVGIALGRSRAAAPAWAISGRKTRIPRNARCGIALALRPPEACNE